MKTNIQNKLDLSNEISKLEFALSLGRSYSIYMIYLETYNL